MFCLCHKGIHELAYVFSVIIGQVNFVLDDVRPPEVELSLADHVVIAVEEFHVGGSLGAGAWMFIASLRKDRSASNGSSMRSLGGSPAFHLGCRKFPQWWHR